MGGVRPTERHQDVGGNVRLGMHPWAYVDGSFEINLPAGTIQVEIHKGPEYRPFTQAVERRSGKLALRFAQLETRLDKKLTEQDRAIGAILSAIRELMHPTPPKRRPIGFTADLEKKS